MTPELWRKVGDILQRLEGLPSDQVDFQIDGVLAEIALTDPELAKEVRSLQHQKGSVLSQKLEELQLRVPQFGNIEGKTSVNSANQSLPIIACPNCQQKLKIAADSAGKRVRCPRCQSVLTVPQQISQSQSDSASIDSDQTTDMDPAKNLDRKNPTKDHQLSFLRPAQSSDELGRLGHYRIVRILGEGGMGLVFQAEDLSLGRSVALKVIRPEILDGKTKERFLLEAQAAAQIDHERVITIYQVGEDNDVPFVAMRLLQGESLKERLDREKILEISDTVRIGQEIAEGLLAAHGKGLIHRDIKPSNIWLEGTKGNVKLLDFGLVKRGGSATGLTKTGTVLGTPAYMAPEQSANRNVDQRADLFSLGCILYECCTGQRPFRGEDLLSLLSAIANETPEPIAALNPHVPSSLVSLIERLLAKQPEQRPENAQIVLVALEMVRRELQSSTEPVRIEPNPIAKPENSIGKDKHDETVPLVPASETNSIGPRQRWQRWRIPLALTLLLVFSGGILLALSSFSGWSNSPKIANHTDKTNTNKKVIDESKDKTTNPKDETAVVHKKDGPIPNPKPEPPRALPVNDKQAPLYPAVKCTKWEDISENAQEIFYSPNGQKFFTVTSNGVIKVWETETKKLLRTFVEHSTYAIELATDAEGKWVVSVDGKAARLWNADTGLVKHLLRPTNGIAQVAISPDGKRFVTADTKKIIAVWDSDSGKQLFEFKQHVKEKEPRDSGKIVGVFFSRDGKKIVSAGPEMVRVWNSETGGEVQSFTPEENDASIRSIIYDQNSEILAVAWHGRLSNNGWHITTWEIETGKKRFEHKLGDYIYNDLFCFSPDGKAMAAIGQTLRVWSADSGKLLLSIADINRQGYRSLNFASDSKALLLCTNDRITEVWTPLTNKDVYPFVEVKDSEPVLQQFSVGNNSIYGIAKYGLKEWDASTAKVLRSIRSISGEYIPYMKSMQFSSDDRYVASIFTNNSLKIWKLATEQIVFDLLKPQKDEINSVAFSPDGRQVVAATSKLATVWQLPSKETDSPTKLFDLEIQRDVCFSLDGNYIAGLNRGSIRLFEAGTGKEYQLNGDKRPTTGGPVFRPGSKQLAYWNSNTVYVQSIETNELVWHSRMSHSSDDMQYSPDGKYLLAASQNDSIISFYNADTGERLFELRGVHDSRISSILFHPSGNWIYTTGLQDDRIMVWRLKDS